ncbi:SDH family Clp fold serine proteinase [Chenggangzhangella methanolivorans]|uniref:Serine dehydrogenase proteinase n=1 Tax=Chenggangzhangella methanolivorans TaxID=1437009 RepID=A0A9E6UNY0_9HYPH|nr:hypothetical protein [Chenggangzhangella methanolivorans]QZN99104.1 hypothetical protein K6K41_19975 [Chenggangzhangella methanolivorans]
MVETAPAPRHYVKTPLFEAFEAARYHRRAQIEAIEGETGRRLLCYISGDKREIERDDILGLVDLLHNIVQGQSIDLMLHTSGGDIDAADKFIHFIFDSIGPTGNLRVIIPDYAKSAGTLIALGANELLMSDSSELGQIDPQVMLKSQTGALMPMSVTAYLAAFYEYSDKLAKDRADVVSLEMLRQFDPFVVRKFQGQESRARTIAQKLLLRNNNTNATKVADELLTEKKWKSHGERISVEEARDYLNLPVTYVPRTAPLWDKVWRLYCLQRLVVRTDKKLFESVFVSQTFEP